jgi:hypothetical protein
VWLPAHTPLAGLVQPASDSASAVSANIVLAFFPAVGKADPQMRSKPELGILLASLSVKIDESNESWVEVCRRSSKVKSSPVCAKLSMQLSAIRIAVWIVRLDISMSKLPCKGSWDGVAQCLAGNRQRLRSACCLSMEPSMDEMCRFAEAKPR